MKKKLAIVGSGIAGMSTAYYLRDHFEISIFEKNDYLGGHTHTHTFGEGEDAFTLDSGFMVFNKETYPNLLKMFQELGVEKQKSDMSFSVYNQDSGLEYGSTDLGSVFAQRKNLLSPRFLKFVYEITKFFKIAKADIVSGKKIERSIRDYCRANSLSDFFRDNYLVPMTAAVWSTPHKEMLDFPMALLLPFFYNHGLLGVDEQFQWYSVKGGSDQYTKRIVASANLDIHLNEKVLKADERNNETVLVTEKGEYHFDYVVLASHSHESLEIASSMTTDKKVILEKFDYNYTKAVIHTDEKVMPLNRRAWASWNQVMKTTDEGEIMTSTHYWLNRLQKPNTDKNYFCSINPWQEIDKDSIVRELSYRHPLYTLENFALQKSLQKLNEGTRVFFAGAYFGYGFHEDGLKAGLKVVEHLKKLL